MTFSPPPSTCRKKQLLYPSWHAAPPTCFTFSSTVSASQSTYTPRTSWTCPLSSPLRHSLFRLRLKYTARPVRTVSSNASRFIQASISTSPVSASWATAGTSPPAFSKSIIAGFTARGKGTERRGADSPGPALLAGGLEPGPDVGAGEHDQGPDP